MRAAAVALSLCLLLSGCRKKTAPEFYRLEGDYSVLVSREGDDAYLSPELAPIITGLQAIGAETVERPKADALLKAIDVEVQRVKKERAAAPEVAATGAPNADALYAGLQQQREAQTAEAAAAQVKTADAKQAEPVKGMSEADFVKAFGACFDKGGSVTLPEGGEASSQKPRDTAECQQKWGVAVWVFGPSGLIGKLVENKASSSSTETKVLDAGRPAQPAPPPVIESNFVIPGRPSGSAEAPPSVNDKAYLNDTPPPTVTPPAP